jgi:hypothetical protein
MPRPQCQGMRPKRTEPNSLSISAQARLATMLEAKPFWPISGGSSVVYWNAVGAAPLSAVGDTMPLTMVAAGRL